MSQHINKLWALLAAALVLGSAQLSAQLSLSTVVSLAQRNSTQVRLAEADIRKAEAALTETKDVFIPSVILGAGLPASSSIGFFGSPPAELTVNIQSQVFSMTQIQYVRAARTSFHAAVLGLKNAHEQVALEASTLYIELDTVHRKLAAVDQQSEFADRLVKIEQDRAEAGVDSLSQLLDAKLATAEIKLKHIHLEAHATALTQQLSGLIGLPASTILTDSASIPTIPALHTDETRRGSYGIESARLIARSKRQSALGDLLSMYTPQINYSAEYYRHTNLLNDADAYFAKPIPTNNFTSGFSFQIPIFDMSHKGKAQESAADALRAQVEVEEAQRQNDLQIATITGNLRELDAEAEVASLKQQLATEQIHIVETEMNLGNGVSTSQQASPKTAQLALIDERQKFEDALDAGFDLAKARLSLLQALGHMEDWLFLLNTSKQPSRSNPAIQAR